MAYDSDVSDVDKNMPQMSGQDGGRGTVCMEGEEEGVTFPELSEGTSFFTLFFYMALLLCPLSLLQSRTFFLQFCL